MSEIELVELRYLGADTVHVFDSRLDKGVFASSGEVYTFASSTAISLINDAPESWQRVESPIPEEG